MYFLTPITPLLMNRTFKIIAALLLVFLSIGFLFVTFAPYLIVGASNIIFLVLSILIVVGLIYGNYRLLRWAFSKPKE